MRRRDLLILGACGSGAIAAAPALAQRNATLREWEIGPLIRGKNYSVNMPLHPSANEEGWYFDFPGPRRRDGHVHYLTRQTGSLVGASGIRLRYRIDALPGCEFIPQEYPERPPLLSLYIQQQGDDWRARGRTLYHRWYSPNSRVVTLQSGENELGIRFEENWISVMGSDRVRSPSEFEKAIANAGRIGFTFGTHGGRGHGIYATAPARFTVLEFSVS